MDENENFTSSIWARARFFANRLFLEQTCARENDMVYCVED